jgi:hypothetical protein
VRFSSEDVVCGGLDCDAVWSCSGLPEFRSKVSATRLHGITVETPYLGTKLVFSMAYVVVLLCMPDLIANEEKTWVRFV